MNTPKSFAPSLLLVALALLIGACSESTLTPEGKTIESPEQARNSWEKGNYRDYSFEFQGGGIPMAPIRPDPWIRITVRNNEVVNAVEIESGEVADTVWQDEPHGYKTIDKLFEWIEEERETGNTVQAAYDAVYGFPVQCQSYFKAAVGGVSFKIGTVTIR